MGQQRLHRRRQGRLEHGHSQPFSETGKQDQNRQSLRVLHRLRGDWRLAQGDWPGAAEAFAEALALARERRLPDPQSETGLALAKLHLGRFPDPGSARAEAERKAAEEKKRQEALKKKQEDERKRREALKKKQEEDNKVKAYLQEERKKFESLGCGCINDTYYFGTKESKKE
jgi:tRNA(Ile)-lysidine synthase TilS/MesJ